MLTLLAAATLAVGPDTVTVRPGDVFVTTRIEGEILVEGGGADRVEVIRTDLDLRFERRGRELHLLPTRGDDRDGEVHVRLPRSTPIRIAGGDLDVVVEGMAASVDVEVREGDVVLESIAGPVRVETLSGDVDLEGIEGDVAVSTLEGSVQLEDVRGEVRVETTDGDVVLTAVSGPRVFASTVDGDVEYAGDVGPGADLTLVTHDGDVVVRLPDGIDATVEAGTFDGSVESEFPIRAQGVRSNEPLRFTLGAGSARISIRSFDGDIRLLRR